MKKMKRLLAVILASLLILSSATAAASAYQAYKDDALTKYDFTDSPVLTTEQYASMILDYADKALAKLNFKKDLPVIGTLDATSINNALSSVYTIGKKKAILNLAGDAKHLKVDMLKDRRRGSHPDVDVIKSVLEFLGNDDNRNIIKKVVVGGLGKYKRSGGLGLGVADSFVKIDLNVEVMLRELIWGLAYPNTAYNSSTTVDTMVQTIIQNALAGVPIIPESVRNLVDLNSTKSTYDFIEDLLQAAYNDMAVPMLNEQVIPWLEMQIRCDETGTLADLFNTGYQVQTYTVPAGSTLVGELNNIAGQIVNGLLKGYTGWVDGDNSKLTDNVVSVARFVLKKTGGYFFPDWQKHIATSEEIDAMSKEELIAYIARSVINGAVGYMYIPEDVTTVVGVTWEAVKQLMAQFLPERDYSNYPKTIDGILDMLADYVAYNVNPGIDLNAGSLKEALNYGSGFEGMLTTAVQWLKADPQFYTGLLPDTTVDTSNGWKALDDIIFKLLDKSLLPAKFANSGSETILKDVVYSVLNGLILNQDLTCLTDLFERNQNGAFATQTLKQSIVRLVTDILNAIIPGTITTKYYDSLDAIVKNGALGEIVYALLGSLNTNKDKLVPPIVNIVAQVMGLSAKSKFGRMEFSGPTRVKGSYSVTLYNGSKGINGGYTDANGNFTRDKLYRYRIANIAAVAYDLNGSTSAFGTTGVNVGDIINGGDSKTLTVNPVNADDKVIALTVSYFILLEDDSSLTGETPITATFYTYKTRDVNDDENYSKNDHNEPTKAHTAGNTSKNKFELTYPYAGFISQNDSPDAISKVKSTISRYEATFHGNGASAWQQTSTFKNGSNAYFEDMLFTKDDGSTQRGWTIVTKNEDTHATYHFWDAKEGVKREDIPNGTYVIRFSVKAQSTRSSGADHVWEYDIPIFVYNDYEVPAKYKQYSGEQRQRSNYSADADAEWTEYQIALAAAANYTLRQKLKNNFSNAAYLAAYEAIANRLDAAAAALDAKMVSSSVDSLKTAVEAVQGAPNPEGSVYWDQGYNFFGYDDFNSVSWNGWKEARNRAMNLYNSTKAPEEPVAPEHPGEGANECQLATYNKKYADWQKAHAAWETAIATWKAPTISSVDVAYAEQQIALWGPRLIKLNAVKTHLDAAIAMCTINPADASKYDAERWEAYSQALAYAQNVSTSFNASTTKRTQVREAMNNLIYNWKRLIAAEVTTVTFTFTVNGEVHAVLTGNQGDPVDLSTIAAPDAPVGMHFVGWGNVPATFDTDASFEAVFANNTDTKYTVNVYNMDTTGAYPSAPDSTYQGAGETGSTADITADAVPAEGFSLDSAKSVLTGTIAADGSLVLKVFYSRNQYTLTAEGVAHTFYYGAAVSVADPVKEHYTFAGWEPELPETMPAHDVTVVAKWTEDGADYTAYNAAVAAAQAKQAEDGYAARYTEASRNALAEALAEDVSGKLYSEQGIVDAATKAINDAVAALELMTYNAIFYVDGAVHATVQAKVGEQIALPEEPAKEGYVFTGWDPEVGVMGLEDVSFNAQFTAGAVSYKVETYEMDVNGAYGAATVKTVPATTGEAVSVTPDAREGFTVDNENSILSGTVAADSSLVLKVYYSRNQYKLSVDGVESDVYFGAALEIADPAPREGYTFTGWNVEIPATMPAENLTLVSQWSENDADYTAYNAAVAAAQAKKGEESYDRKYTAETRAALAEALANDVSGKKYSEQGVVDAATKAINDAVAALELMTYTATFYVDGAVHATVTAKVGEQIVAPADPAKEGYIFKGWDKEVGKMGVEDVSFNAEFEEATGIAYTVETYTMDVNGNYGAAETKTLYGTTGATVNADTTAAEGFTFDESADNVVSGEIAADGSLVLKVYFARNQYKLTVDGVESMVYYGAALEFANPTKEHETFNGWNPELPETMPAHDVTVVSTWIKDDADYTEYRAARAHAEGIVNDSEYAYEATYTAESRAALDAALAIVVPEGLKYDEQHIIDAAEKAIEDAVLGLELMRYKVTYLNDDGSVFAEFDGDKGGLVSYRVPVPSENPTKEGYVFTGWDPKIPANMPAHELTFTAQFSAGEVTYTVETYVMGLDGEYGAAESMTVPATTGEEVSLIPEGRNGFTVADNSVLSGIVAADGSLTLKIYYSRNQYKLTVDGVESDVYFGAALEIADPAPREGYTFTGWNVEVPATMPAENLTLVSQWSENDADYTAYNAAVAAAQAKQGEENYDRKYTAETRAALAAVLAEDVSGKKYSEQGVVDAATQAINDAVAALELETYTATFYVNGEVHATVTAKVGEQIAAPADPIVDGYNFTGWDPEVGTMGIENVSFNAILVANNSSIISVTPESPNYGGMHQYAIKVKGEPQKIRIVDAFGNTRTFDRNTSMTSDANALGILKIEKTDDGEIWTINVNIPEGRYVAFAKFGKDWEENGHNFSVRFDVKPEEPTPDGVLEVTYNTPNYGGKQEYTFKVSGKADKIQVVCADGGTITLSRLDPRVTVKSYDAEGIEVYSNSTNLAYEIWTVKLDIPAGRHIAKAKYGRSWTAGTEFDVIIDAKPVSAVSVTEVKTSADSVEVTVNGTATKIKITDASGATRTYDRDHADVSIAPDGDGEIWTINAKLRAGEYTATAKYIANDRQVWDTTDFAFTV